MTILNAILFKVNWIACVVGGTFWGVGGIACLIAFSFWAKSWRVDLPLVLILSLTGAVLDTMWIYLGILDYQSPIAPLWIIMLWAGLAFTIHHAMSLFIHRPLLGATLSGLAAPVTYLSGERLGAVIVPDPLMLSVVMVTWFVLFYIVFKSAQRTYQTSEATV